MFVLAGILYLILTVTVSFVFTVIMYEGDNTETKILVKDAAIVWIVMQVAVLIFSMGM